MCARVLVSGIPIFSLRPLASSLILSYNAHARVCLPLRQLQRDHCALSLRRSFPLFFRTGICWSGHPLRPMPHRIDVPLLLLYCLRTRGNAALNTTFAPCLLHRLLAVVQQPANSNSGCDSPSIGVPVSVLLICCAQAFSTILICSYGCSRF